jgi:hypothetical protein
MKRCVSGTIPGLPCVPDEKHRSTATRPLGNVCPEWKRSLYYADLSEFVWLRERVRKPKQPVPSFFHSPVPI